MLIFKEVVLIINVNKIVYLDVCSVATFYELKISPTRRMIEVERTQKKKVTKFTKLRKHRHPRTECLLENLTTYSSEIIVIGGDSRMTNLLNQHNS